MPLPGSSYPQSCRCGAQVESLLGDLSGATLTSPAALPAHPVSCAPTELAEPLSTSAPQGHLDATPLSTAVQSRGNA